MRLEIDGKTLEELVMLGNYRRQMDYIEFVE